MAGEIRNRLLAMMNNPGSYTGSPGYQFALNSGLQGVNRRAAAGGIRGSGNALAELVRYGTGLAQQDYGNEFDRLTRAYGVEDQGDVARERNANDLTLGQGRLDVDRTRNANDFTLGQGALDVNRQNANTTRDLGFGRLGLDAYLGSGQLAETTRAHNLDYGLGMTRANNDFTLGSQQNQNTAQRNWWDYDLGGRAADTAGYNARTARGQAQSNAWYQQDQRRGFWNPPTTRPAGVY